MKPVLVLDLEVYRDYFLAAFKDVLTGEVFTYEMYSGQPLKKGKISGHLLEATIVTFNGNGYDIPILSYALDGAECQDLKDASDAIIVHNFRGWQLAKKFKFELLTELDHIDLIEVAPGMVGLKIYGGRLHTPRMQDLPIDPAASIDPAMRNDLREYCVNDLAVTEALYEHLTPQIKLREEMGAKYGLELRSKSDAQIAEAVIGSSVFTISGDQPVRPEIPTGTTYRYTAPAFIHFESLELNKVLQRVQADDFIVTDSGKLNEPEWMRDLRVPIGASEYRMGIGGLHSTESCMAHVADENTLLLDRDVASYYPNIILTCGLYPKHLGAGFLKVYRGIVAQRLKAKREGDKVTNEALKIVINGSFGKFGSKWSILYSPDLLIKTTITGQLALLMLIEQLEINGIAVVSANTDGIVIKCPVALEDVMECIVAGWEMITGFDTEETRYTALYSRDVNNYIAIKDKGYKAKGAFALDRGGIHKNPVNEISTLAAIQYLRDGTPIEETVRGCTDIRRFVTVRSVKGGALGQLGEYLGKAVRWYYSTAVEGVITYKVNGYSVPRTEGAMPCMELPDHIPEDLDHEWYVREAYSILNDVGATNA